MSVGVKSQHKNVQLTTEWRSIFFSSKPTLLKDDKVLTNFIQNTNSMLFFKISKKIRIQIETKNIRKYTFCTMTHSKIDDVTTTYVTKNTKSFLKESGIDFLKITKNRNIIFSKNAYTHPYLSEKLVRSHCCHVK